MTNQGLVYRRSDPDDKRVQRVFLTERGRALQQVVAPVEDVVEHALRGFTTDERDFFMRLLSRALHNFAE
jgi:MarR family transcriptional regulator, organic hydroperoxide resistance regulator